MRYNVAKVENVWEVQFIGWTGMIIVLGSHSTRRKAQDALRRFYTKPKK